MDREQKTTQQLELLTELSWTVNRKHHNSQKVGEQNKRDEEKKRSFLSTCGTNRSHSELLILDGFLPYSTMKFTVNAECVYSTHCLRIDVETKSFPQ